MTTPQYLEFIEQVKSKGIDWLLPHNLPQLWLDILIEEEAAAFSSPKPGNYDGLIHAVLCLMNGSPVTIDQCPYLSKGYLSQIKRNISFYICMLSLQAIANLTNDSGAPHVTPAITHFINHPVTVETIFSSETARQITGIDNNRP